MVEGVFGLTQNKRVNIYSVLKGVFLVLLVFATLYPFIYMVSVSLSQNIYVLRNEVSFYPKGFNLRMYDIILKDARILTGYKNTVTYVAVGTVISLSVTCMAAYALSKTRRLLFHSFFTFLIVFTMFFGGGLIPTYLTITKTIGLYDNLWAVILPSSISTYNLILMRSFFKNFPLDIEESGCIDGLNDIKIFWYLVLPLSKAVMATIGLFYTVSYWNSFMGPFIYLKNSSKYPLQVILRNIVLTGTSFDQELVGANGDIVLEQPLKFAAIIVTILPIMAVYPFLQKYFVKGVMIGSLKG